MKKRPTIRHSRSARDNQFGKFIGKPQTVWEDDGRNMTLLQDFIYEDPKHQIWAASVGSAVNGASIPQIFWSLIGGPFEGRYRNASVIHDTECTSPYKHDWRDVHRMFYFGCRAGGVPEAEAKLMFAAVYQFGPRWTWKAVRPPKKKTVSPLYDTLRMKALLRKNPDMSLKAIEGFTHEVLINQVSDDEVEQERRIYQQSLGSKNRGRR